MPKQFYKYQAGGNDFLFFDDREQIFPYDAIAGLCHRRFGIGADGLVLLQPSAIADYRMRYFNCDGKEADMCGNALRALARFIPTYIDSKKNYQIETESGIRKVQLLDDGRVKVSLGKPEGITLQTIQMDGKNYHLFLARVGVPHAVLFVDDLNAPLQTMQKIRIHTGANVNFVQHQEKFLQMRTYERGVEGETLACGTGGAAVAAIFFLFKQANNPVSISFYSKELVNYYLKIEKEIIQDIEMIGESHFIFNGEIDKLPK